MKKAILLVSFGTTFKDTREKNLDRIRKDIEEKFEAYDVFEAYTSSIVRKRVEKNEGISYLSVREKLQILKDEGYEEVFLQPTHVIPGIEYDKACRQARETMERGFVVHLGKPLLYSPQDYIYVTENIKEKFGDLPLDQAVLYMSHGTDSEAFTSYTSLDYFFQGSNIYTSCVEGFPGIETSLEHMKGKGYKKIHLYPFMIVAGDHAHNDMAGDDEDSWARILEKEGYQTEEHLQGLGEEKFIRDLFIEKLEETIKTRRVKLG